MYKIPGDTLFVGKNLIVLPTCDSTNTVAAEWSTKQGVPEGTVVITHRQEAGRGQRGNSWESQPGMNLTFSIILHPKTPSADFFDLNLAVSLAVYDALNPFAPGRVAVKWPNDIMFSNRKICGILIENTISSGLITRSVAGIGVNVNQESFTVSTATSLRAETGNTYDLNELLASILRSVETRYMQAKTAPSQLRSRYLDCLYRRHVQHKFQSGNEVFHGMIDGVDSSGRLQINTSTGMRTFATKEIAYLD